MDGDIRICNLEVALADSGTPFEKTYTYCMPTRHAGAVAAGCFDVVHLANNHILDFGVSALSSTLRLLDSMGIGHTGAGTTIAHAREPALVRKGSVITGFLSYSCTFPEEFWATSTRPGTAFCDSSYLARDIPALREKVDYLVVSFHWGAERMTVPKDYQRALGRYCIDLGADAVLGHHPHVLQGIEVYKGRPIAYSLGNFTFSTWTNAVWDSGILRLFFADRMFVKAEFVPVLINNFKVELQPRILKGEEAQRTLKNFSALCDSVGTTLVIDGDRGYIKP